MDKRVLKIFEKKVKNLNKICPLRIQSQSIQPPNPQKNMKQKSSPPNNH